MKSTITRERLQEITEDGFLKHGESKELARMALTAMDGEPVAWMSKGGTVLNGMRQSPHDFVHYNIPLYRHAQPAPVVPEIDRKAIADKVYGMCCRIPGATFYNAAEFAIDEVEACRATMLVAAPRGKI
ncbi:hypothetical protein ACHWHM_17400 [Klebsiella pneumoniae]|uniref:hypothetical protein n=1 Tax=Klebsiella pneumoniae TaxID=573 RepID=UPI00376F3D06